MNSRARDGFREERLALGLLIPLVLFLGLGGPQHLPQDRLEGADGRRRLGNEAGRLDGGQGRSQRPGLHLRRNIKKGDILLLHQRRTASTTRSNCIKNLWKPARSGQKAHLPDQPPGRALLPSLTLGQKGVSLIYFYLALIGLMTLIIALIVFFNSARPFALPNIYFYLLSVVLYSFYIFSRPASSTSWTASFTGWTRSPSSPSRRSCSTSSSSFPSAKSSCKTQAVGHLPPLCAGRRFSSWPRSCSTCLISTTWTTASILRHLRRPRESSTSSISPSTRSSLWPRSRTATSAIPASWSASSSSGSSTASASASSPSPLLYIIPFLAGRAPTQVAELTILLQAFIPLAFSYSISRYKLMDLEVILKKAATLVFSYFVLALLYLGVGAQTKIFSENG